MTILRHLWLRLLSSFDPTNRTLKRVLKQKWKKKTMRIVLSRLESRKSAEDGRLALGLVAVRERWDCLARDAFTGLPDAMLVRYALPEASKVLSKSDPKRAKTLLRSGRERWADIGSLVSGARHLSLAITSAYFGDEEGIEQFTAAIRKPTLTPEVENLRRCFAEQQHTARSLGVAADYSSVRDAAHVGSRTGRAKERVIIGLLDYRSPLESSINLGDYIQTIAMIGQISRFEFKALSAPEAVCDLLKQGQPSKAEHSPRQNLREGEVSNTICSPVELLPVSRDFPVTVAGKEGPIWLPVCGWFSNPAYPGHYDFPFPANIRPLFMALHIARPDILTEGNLAYLRRFEPIGCRDLFTARLLRGAGVKAFFNGCATMTLDRLRPPHSGKRAGRYHGAHRIRDTNNYKSSQYNDCILSPHDDPECLVRDFDGNLRAAIKLIDRYYTAEEVRTGLVHCWLPCRAMGVPVTLTEELNRADPRLSGFTDMDDAVFRTAALQFETVVQPVLAAILDGQGEADVYALWRKVTKQAMTRTDVMITERSAKTPLKEIHLDTLGLDQIPVRSFGDADPRQFQRRESRDHPLGQKVSSTERAITLLFAFDNNLAKHFSGTFEGIWRHRRDRDGRPLVVHVFGRGLNSDMFERWAVQFPGVQFVWRDLSNFTFGDALHLGCGITVSTLDRLLAPGLLPDVEKVVWLDVDVLVRTDIADLFDTPLGDSPLAARRNDVNESVRIGARYPYESDQYISRSEDEIEAFRDAFFAGAPTVFEGFNAGVLVMNLAQLRSEHVMETALALVGTCGVNDQTALNFATRGRWKRLTQKSVMLLIQNWFQENPAIVHFTGHVKPWAEKMPVSFWKDWRENASRARRRDCMDSAEKTGSKKMG